MADRNMKRFSTLLNQQQNANQKQRYHIIPVRMVTTKKKEKLSVGKYVKKLEPLCTVG